MSFPSSFHYENESDFIRRLIMPVLQRLGFSAVTNYRGTREHGKDLVFGETDRFDHLPPSGGPGQRKPGLRCR